MAWGMPFGSRAIPPALEDLGPIGEPDLERTLDDEADLVLAAMDMHPVAGARLERRLEEVDRCRRSAGSSACA